MTMHLSFKRIMFSVTALVAASFVAGCETLDATGSSENIITQPRAESGSDGVIQTIPKYNKKDDTYTVEGLAFDFNNIYTRDRASTVIEGQLNAGNTALDAKVYEADPNQTYADGGAINLDALKFRLLKVDSKNGDLEAYIVRSADTGYTGGWLMNRTSGFSLPRNQAAVRYEGDYTGIREYRLARGELQGGIDILYVRGDAEAIVDFYDLQGDGERLDGNIRLYVDNREYFDTDGVALGSQTVLDWNGVPIPVELTNETVVFMIDGGPIIQADGTFSLPSGGDSVDQGVVTGIFAGRDAETLGGIIELDYVGASIPISSDIELQQRETGAVIMTRIDATQ